MAVCGTGISSISSVDGISGVILPPTQVIVEKLAEQIEFSHLAQSLRDRISVITDLENGLTQVNSLVTTETGILAQELLALKNDLTGAVAYINEQTTVDTNARQAMVASINTLMAGFDSKIAALEEKSAIQANINGSLLAEKTVKIDLAGNVAGYGLSAYMDPDGNFDSDFQVRADTFSIAPPAVSSPNPPENPYHGMVWVDTSLGVNETRWYNSENGQWSILPVKGAVPFVVKTSPETVDGITTAPGVYIDSAYISQIKANQIDTRGLAIRDADGNVLFAAGTALDWANVGGANKPANGATVGAPSGTYVGGVLAQNVESQSGAQARADAAANWAASTAQTYAAAQANLAKINAQAYADGIVTAEEERAIADATAKAEAAKTAAINAAAADATAKANQASEAAKTYAAAQANLAKVSAEAYADGKVSAEEQRAINDATAKAEAARVAAVAAAALDASAKANATKTAVEAYAAAQAELAKTTAQAYADGKVTAEETRAIADATAKAEAARVAAVAAAAADATAKATAAQNAAQLYAAAQAELAKVTASAHADGIVTDAEARLIADATAKADAARVNAINAAALDATAKANQASETAKTYAAAQANLAKVNAEAYADGKVSAEEQRAINDAAAKAEAARVAAVTAAAADATAKADAAKTAAINAAAADATNKVSAKLDKASGTILNVATSGTTYVGGLRVGDLTWNADGDWTGGKGLALTPQGIVAHNGTETTFTVNASTGDVYAKGELVVPDASITTAKIGELSVDGLRIKGGAVTYTAMQTLTNTWTETTEKVIGFIDFSSMSSEGIFLKVIVEPTTISPINTIGELDYSKIQVSGDGTTWFDLEKAMKVAHQVCDYNSEVSSCWTEYDLATVPFGQRICKLNPSRFAHSPNNEYYYWKGTAEVYTLLTNYHVWANPVTNPSILEFGIRIPSVGTYELTYCADDYVDAGSNTYFHIHGASTALPAYTYPNVPNKHTFSTTAASTYARLNVSARNAAGWYGFAAYIKNTATGEIVWHSRRVNEYPDLLKYVRVVAKKYGSAVPNINAWLGVEIVRK